MAITKVPYYGMDEDECKKSLKNLDSSNSSVTINASCVSTGNL